MIRNLALAALAGMVSGYIALAEKRADHWGAILSRDLALSGSPPLHHVSALPGKGCGWSLGETAWGWTEMGGVRTRVLICRNWKRVRLDITNYDSRWIR